MHLGPINLMDLISPLTSLNFERIEINIQHTMLKSTIRFYERTECQRKLMLFIIERG